MSETVIVKVNVGKIDKTALFEGAKGKYLDLILIPTPDSQWGDTHMVVQGLPKERRDKGEKGPILGGAKPLGGNRPPQQQQSRYSQPQNSNSGRYSNAPPPGMLDDDSNSIPF